jgi:hypothetical protein
MRQQKNSDGASLREKVTRLDRPLTKNQPEMRSKGLVELSTMFNVSTTQLQLPRPPFENLCPICTSFFDRYRFFRQSYVGVCPLTF